ncbi:hypothetical protein BN946_scf184910.g19 [Trametes cinnabarina]|uniref:Uncharacterized protein n=1 Tax=Pycnoporus cinnabarinus TaxID=5643 RepID=A0A060SAY8_PYCCI|nr:hypothetical protein BN946_scf184910.g19 [Trametes cinnabarina]
MAATAVSSTSSTSVLDWFKPIRSEAIARLRTNSVGLVGLVIFTNLLPVPSLWTAFDVIWHSKPTTAPYYYLCAVELGLLALLVFNVLQAGYALKYPRAPLPPPPSSAKAAKSTPLSPPAARQWRLSGISPQASPQRQKAFSSYAPSPVSTPSRTINYTIPSSVSSPPDASFASSVSVPGSPASPLAAYRGRHSTSVGRAFDGSLLSRLARDEDSDEEEV